MCTKCLGARAKTAIFDDFGGVVIVKTADTPKPEPQVCVEFKYELYEACEKCAKNV